MRRRTEVQHLQAFLCVQLWYYPVIYDQVFQEVFSLYVKFLCTFLISVNGIRKHDWFCDLTRFVLIHPKYSIYPQSQLIIFTSFLFCLFTTCFGPYGPSSGETQQHYLYIYENHHTTAHPLFYNYSLIIYLSTLKSYNDNSLTASVV
jgi:hypothetical protein